MKNFFAIFIFTIFILNFPLLSQDKQDWKFVHPLPHSNGIKKIKMVDANTWIGAGAYGLYMRTTNSGSNWYFQNMVGRTNATLTYPYNYDLWFFNASTGIVVGDQGYVGRTTNGGLTFDSVAAGLIPTNSRCWSVWFANSNTGYVGAGSQTAYNSNVLKTTNGGLNWTSVYSNTSNYINCIGGFDSVNVFAIMANGNILKTTNGGDNWVEAITPGFAFSYNIEFYDSNTGFIASNSGRVFRTTNSGLSWDTVSTPQVDWSIYQVKMFSPSEVYAVGHPAYLYKTTDLGNTWSPLPISVTGPASTYLWYSLDKKSNTYIMAGDYGIVAKSTDAGISWNSNHFSLSTQLMYDITSVPGTGKYWTVGRPFASTTRQVLYSSNNGNNWISYDAGVTGDFFAINMLNSQTGYISGQNSQVLKTTNGGMNWTMLTKPHTTNYSLYSMKFINENTGWVFVNYAVVSGGNVFKTTDGGNSWNQYSIGAGTSENIISATMINENTGYCTLNPSNKPVYKTTNGGINWTAYTTGLTGNLKSISAPDSNTVYVCQTAGTSRVGKSTNGGLNWSLITLPIAADFTSISFKDINTGYVCGNSTTAICRTTNGGMSWDFQNTHNVTLGKVYASNGDTAFALGGLTSIFRFTGPTYTSVQYNGNDIPNGYFLKQNYPNPFNPVTTIEFNIPKTSFVTLKIYDISGKEYKTDINGMTLNPGSFKIKYDGSNLSSGIYFYKLTAGNYTSTKKMILIK